MKPKGKHQDVNPQVNVNPKAKGTRPSPSSLGFVERYRVGSPVRSTHAMTSRTRHFRTVAMFRVVRRLQGELSSG